VIPQAASGCTKSRRKLRRVSFNVRRNHAQHVRARDRDERPIV